jgi:3-phosphoshikimate 1-carboxyvinyltransferase
VKRLRVPGDKSISHRALLLAARADGVSRVTGLSDGSDVLHTAAAVVSMGARIEGDRIHGGRLHAVDGVIDVGNSGTGMRLLAGWCAPFPWRTVLRGDESVDRRPMGRVTEPLRLMGAQIDESYPPLTIEGGGLHGIDYALPVPSAQVKGAVLLAGLGADGETIVREAVPTRMHTEELLQLAGADVELAPGVARVRPSTLQPFELDVPGDPSQAAFWVVAASVVPGMELTIEHVYVGPGRVGFLDVLRRMGADIEVEGDDIHVRAASLHATEVGGDEVPGLIDEIPILAVAAACAEGTTVFRDAAELRVKESDRLGGVAGAISALGGGAAVEGDDLIVAGGGLAGGTVSSGGDHRMAMALAVAGLAARGPVTIEGMEAADVSFPGFVRTLVDLGAGIEP